MKKYNLSRIMKRAWELVKKAGETISSGLKKAWQEVKKMAKKMTYEAIEKAAQKYAEDNYPNTGYLTVNRWTKYEKDRVYFNVCRRNHRGHKTAGYWDLIEEKYVAPEKGINLAEV